MFSSMPNPSRTTSEAELEAAARHQEALKAAGAKKRLFWLFKEAQASLAQIVARSGGSDTAAIEAALAAYAKRTRTKII